MTARARIFDDRLSREWIGFRILRRAIIAVAIVHFSLAAVSGYRAVFQVRDSSFDPVPAVLTPGSPVTARFTTSGRTFVSARVELVQRGHTEILARSVVPMNEAFFYDPRSKHGDILTVIPADVFARFSEGPATLRAVAEGQSQWLHVPPPKIRELSITLAR